jgi:hypothetical protein
MSKLDQDTKPETTFSLNSEKVRESYAKRLQMKQSDDVKGRGAPLGGALPIEKGKLSPLVQPVFDSPEDKEPEDTKKPFSPPAKPPITGVGSAYTFNQAMARGDTESPMNLKEAKQLSSQQPKNSILSEETSEGLRKLAEAQAAQEAQATVKDEHTEGLEKAEETLTEKTFDFDAIIGARNSLMSKERKKTIEARLPSMDIADLISKKEILQIIPVIPNKLHVSLRTYSQREMLFCMRYCYDFPGSPMYQEELLNTCKLVCSLVAINGSFLPDHRTNIGKREEEVDRKMFENKLFHVSSFPVHLLADLSVQAMWFSDRVNNLFSLDNLKNG